MSLPVWIAVGVAIYAAIVGGRAKKNREKN